MTANPPSPYTAATLGVLGALWLTGCGVLEASEELETIETQGHINDPGNPGTYPLPSLELTAETPIEIQRLIFDSTDLETGFQLHPVYVVPAGDTDLSRDETGEIGQLMHQATEIQEALFGHHVPVDKRQDESLDVSFLASQYSVEELFAEGNRPGRLLLQEFLEVNDPGLNRKLYLFLVEASLQSTQRESYCGLTPLHEGYFAWHSTVLLGEGCSGVSDEGVLYSARAIVHEVLHGLGVDTHSASSIDILCGYPYTCITGGVPVADRVVSEYFFGDAEVDIAELRVWEGHLNDSLLKYPCSRSFETACGLEERRVILSKVCYERIEPAEILWIDESRVETAGSALMTFDPSCPEEAPYGVSAAVSAPEPTTKQYRIRVGDSISPEPRRIHFQY